MQVKPTPFEGLFEIIPAIFQDSRGYFFESYKEDVLRQAGIMYSFPQENQSFSKKGVIRGLHMQMAPHAQAKLVTVISGKVMDVVVDVRRGSPTFGQVYYCELDGQRHNMLMVPDGFAHGFVALEDSVFSYKCSHVYHKAAEQGIIWNDPTLNIQWNIQDPIVSDKDQQLPTFNELIEKSVISR